MKKLRRTKPNASCFKLLSTLFVANTELTAIDISKFEFNLELDFN